MQFILLMQVIYFKNLIITQRLTVLTQRLFAAANNLVKKIAITQRLMRLTRKLMMRIKLNILVLKNLIN